MAPENRSALWFPELAALSQTEPWQVPFRSDVLSQASAPPARGIGTAVSLASERLILQGKGLSAPSTSSLYAAKWCTFSKWCDRNRAVASLCKVESVLAFLQYLLEKGLAFSTIKVYAAAVSTDHVGCDGIP